MHERSLVQALLTQVERLMVEQGGDEVVTVNVTAGEFSGVEPDLLQSAFAELAEVSPVRGATLQLQRAALEAKCRECGREFPVRNYHFICEACGGRDVTILRGEGLVLESVTLRFAGDQP